MAGYAKRWLIIFADGTLSYAMNPEGPSRGVIDVPHASVSSDIRHGTLNDLTCRHDSRGQWLDGDPYVPCTDPDIKMLNSEDFEVWRSHLRKFLQQYHPHGAATEGSAAQETQGQEHDIIASSIATLQGVLAQYDIPEVALVVQQLQQLQDSAPQSRRQSRGRPNSGVAGISGFENAKGGGMLVGAQSTGSSTPSSFYGNDDADFYDADEAFDGIEYAMDDDEDEEGDYAEGDYDNGNDDDYQGEEPQPDSHAVVGAGAAGDAAAATGSGDDSQQAQTSASSRPRDVTYRKQLPATVTGEEMSLFSILKKNVGKDLSTISFPVTFNCPLSLLQAAAEEYEYAPLLLERAAKSSDSTDRIALVGAFAVSGYASTANRSSRKPFNPLLGETYECVRADRNMYFVAEKVVHRPPVVASYCKGDGWSVSAAGTVKNKFWGKSLELIAEGTEIVELEGGDRYSITKPSSFMRNLLAGNKYLEHVGDLTVQHLNSKEKLVINFKEGTMFGGNRNNIEGTIYDNSNNKVGTIKGKWDEQVARVIKKDQLQVLWEAEPMPHNAANYYGFTNFALSLNEITPDIDGVLPPTDSRLRPDQRALENGDADSAEQLKHELENSQRARRKELEDAGKTHEPQWFHHGSNGLDWEYGGADGRKYFDEREEVHADKQKWKVSGAHIFDTK